RDSVTLADGSGFTIDGCFAFTFHDEEDFAHFGLRDRTNARIITDDDVIEIAPGRGKHCGPEGATYFHRTGATVIVFDVAKTVAAKIGSDELRDLVKLRTNAVIAKIEIVVEARQQADIDVQPLDRFVSVVVDSVIASQTRRRCGRTLQLGGTAVDRELSGTV